MNENPSQEPSQEENKPEESGMIKGPAPERPRPNYTIPSGGGDEEPGMIKSSPEERQKYEAEQQQLRDSRRTSILANQAGQDQLAPNQQRAHEESDSNWIHDLKERAAYLRDSMVRDYPAILAERNINVVNIPDTEITALERRLWLTANHQEVIDTLKLDIWNMPYEDLLLLKIFYDPPLDVDRAKVREVRANRLRELENKGYILK